MEEYPLKNKSGKSERINGWQVVEGKADCFLQKKQIPIFHGWSSANGIHLRKPWLKSLLIFSTWSSFRWLSSRETVERLATKSTSRLGGKVERSLWERSKQLAYLVLVTSRARALSWSIVRKVLLRFTSTSLATPRPSRFASANDKLLPEELSLSRIISTRLSGGRIPESCRLTKEQPDKRVLKIELIWAGVRKQETSWALSKLHKALISSSDTSESVFQCDPNVSEPRDDKVLPL